MRYFKVMMIISVLVAGLMVAPAALAAGLPAQNSSTTTQAVAKYHEKPSVVVRNNPLLDYFPPNYPYYYILPAGYKINGLTPNQILKLYGGRNNVYLQKAIDALNKEKRISQNENRQIKQLIADGYLPGLTRSQINRLINRGYFPNMTNEEINELIKNGRLPARYYNYPYYYPYYNAPTTTYTAPVIHQATVSISPRTGLPGTQVRVTVNYFPANTPVNVSIGQQGQQMTSVLAGTTSSAGYFTTLIDIPTTAVLGQQWVATVATTSGEAVQVTSPVFTIQQPTTAAYSYAPSSSNVYINGYYYPSGTKVYVVQRNDSLNTIAAQYGTTVNALIKSNPFIPNGGEIFVGERLAVPFNNGPYVGSLSPNGY